MLLILYILYFNSVFVKSEESDITSVKISNVVGEGGDYSLDDEKEITLNGENSEKKARVRPKESMFSKSFKIKDCIGSECKSESLSDKKRSRLSKCHFKGKLVDDPDSTVQVSGCLRKGGMDMSVMSSQGGLKHNLYRIGNDGKVNVGSNLNFTDVLSKKGVDYSDTEDGDLDNEIPVWIDREGYAVTIHDMPDDPEHGKKDCCRAKRTKCINLKAKKKKCTSQKGRVLCGIKCERIKKFSLKEAAELKQELKEDKSSNSEPTTTEKSISIGDLTTGKYKSSEESEEQKKENTVESEHRNKMLESKESESKESESKESKSKESGSKESQIKESESEKTESKKSDEKPGSELSKKELVRIVQAQVKASEHQEKVKNAPKNPKCSRPEEKKKVTTFVFGQDGKSLGTMMDKDPYPQEKIYDQETIEVGLFIDRHLYKKMTDAIKSTDDAEVNDAFVDVIHNLMMEVENFLQHKSFSKKHRFKIAIHGIHIYKDHNDPLIAEWDSAKVLKQMVDKFVDFAKKVNNPCDADEDSYDAMVLMSGREDYRDIMGGSAGQAMTGEVCSMYPAIVFTMKLDENGNHRPLMGRLLAHEFGHLLGSQHDGVPYESTDGLFPMSEEIPCQQEKWLMSPAVSKSTTEWSECTQKQIDNAYEKRDKDKKNCLFT